MQREQIVFVGTSDLSGHFRGKSFPVADLPARLERGVGGGLAAHVGSESLGSGAAVHVGRPGHGIAALVE